MICFAYSRASAGVFAIFTPPPLPRPPAWIWAFTTTPAAPAANRFLAAVWASSRVLATSPRGTATPYLASRVLAWYSWIFMDGRRRSFFAGLKPRQESSDSIGRHGAEQTLCSFEARPDRHLLEVPLLAAALAGGAPKRTFCWKRSSR